MCRDECLFAWLKNCVRLLLRGVLQDNIDPKLIKKLTATYMKDPDFLPDRIKAVSSAATSLCMWVRAMHVYDRVAKNIEPKVRGGGGGSAVSAPFNPLPCVLSPPFPSFRLCLSSPLSSMCADPDFEGTLPFQDPL